MTVAEQLTRLRSNEQSAEFATLVDLVAERARTRGDDTYFVHIADGINESSSLTFAQLDNRARAIAAQLSEITWSGDRALLIYPPGTDFVTGFFGCLYAGIVAVPVPPIGSNRNGAGIERLTSIARSSGARTILTCSELAGELEEKLAELDGFSDMSVVCSDLIGEGAGPIAEIGPDTVAYLQYSSGSTGNPKGVVLTHRSVLANLQAIHQACGLSESDSLVGWLPHFHDMGLVSQVLQPLYTNGRAWTMPPKLFVKHPVRWLDAISRYRATISVAPNFAYELSVHRVSAQQVEDMDLSCWKVALCGAEPIRAEALRRFADHFAPSGFETSTFLPCYGMAEATLMVTGGPHGGGLTVGTFDPAAIASDRLVRSGPGGRELVASGSLLDEPSLVVVDQSTVEPLPDGSIGEICISGASVCSGYFDNDIATEQAFDPRVAARLGGSYLRTGDLGAVLDGQLYVTGRCKDLIIRDGRNHYPQDLERSAELSHGAIRPYGCAAFAVEDGNKERVVMIVEVERSALADETDEAVARKIIDAVWEDHALSVDDVCLVDWFAIPLTSSGKVQRFACKEKFLKGELHGSPHA